VKSAALPGRSSPARTAFAGFRFPAEVIVVAVRWYLRYSLSYRDVEELLAERGIEVARRRRTGLGRTWSASEP
jgi:transposase-like protein